MARNYLTEDQYYNYPIDEAQTIFNLQNPDKEFLDFYLSKPRDLGFFPTSISQNPAMVNYGIGTLPQFDMANLPMYEKDDSEQESGIAKLFQFLGNLPTPFNLARRGLESLRGFNDRIRNTAFGQSRTGAEFAMRRREQKQADRAREAMPNVYRDAANVPGALGRGGGFSSSFEDRAGTSLGSGQFSSKRSTGRQGY